MSEQLSPETEKKVALAKFWTCLKAIETGGGKEGSTEKEANELFAEIGGWELIPDGVATIISPNLCRLKRVNPKQDSTATWSYEDVDAFFNKNKANK